MTIKLGAIVAEILKNQQENESCLKRFGPEYNDTYALNLLSYYNILYDEIYDNLNNLNKKQIKFSLKLLKLFRKTYGIREYVLS